MLFKKGKNDKSSQRDDRHSDTDRYGRRYNDAVGSDYDDRYDRYERERYGSRGGSRDYDDYDRDSDRQDYDRDSDRRDYDRDRDRDRDWDDRERDRDRDGRDYESHRHGDDEHADDRDDDRGYDDIEGYGGESDSDFSEEYYTEESHEATYQSMRKARRYLVISLVTLVAVVAAGFFLFQSVKKQAATNRTNCWTCQLTVEERVSKYVKENGLTANPAYLEDVPNAIVDYQCKDGGSYTWYPVSGSYVCSEHGHHPDDFGEQQSKVTGTNATAIETKKSD